MDDDATADLDDGAARAVAGAWVGLALVLLANRARVLACASATSGGAAHALGWTLLAAYQDVLLVGALAIASAATLRRLERPRLRRVVAAAALALALLAALYSALATEVFAMLGTPLTGRLLALSDGLRGVRTSLWAAATPSRVALLLAAPAVVGMLAAWCRRRPAIARALPAPRSIALACGAWTLLAVAALPEPGADAVANPHAVLLASLIEREPAVPSAITAAVPFPSGAQGTVRPPSPLGGSLAGSNVLLVVLESVGAEVLAAYGASLDVAPTITRLASSGVVFERVHAQQPRSSSAMAALVSSLSPWSRRQTIPRVSPEVGVPGLADALGAAGHRSAFFHSGDLSFENERRFLAGHGFATVRDATDVVALDERLAAPGAPPAATHQAAGSGVDDRESLRAARRERRRARRRAREQFGQLADRALVAPALAWVDRDPETPFLLVLWTIQTHAPYVNVEPPVPLAPHDPSLDRYLNALREADRMLAELLDGLARRGVLDTTLVIVTGDHGEAFGAHGVRFHGRSLHDDEVLVPLVLSHPGLRAAPRRSSTVAQQIDVAPTVLDLLGLPVPDAWQGTSLFATQRPGEAFLVNVFETTRFGLVRGDRKYVFDERLEPVALYDRTSDPDERRDLSASPAERDAIAAARERVAGWLRAQNAYLEQLFTRSPRAD